GDSLMARLSYLGAYHQTRGGRGESTTTNSCSLHVGINLPLPRTAAGGLTLRETGFRLARWARDTNIRSVIGPLVYTAERAECGPDGAGAPDAPKIDAASPPLGIAGGWRTWQSGWVCPNGGATSHVGSASRWWRP